MGHCGKVFIVIAAIVAGLLYTKFTAMTAPAELTPMDVQEYWGPKAAAASYKEDKAIRPFTVAPAKEAIEKLVARLREPLGLVAPLEGIGFEYGTNSVALEEIVRYWRDDYLPRWPKRLELLNQFGHFKTQIQGLDIHYLHIKPTVAQRAGKRVIPLLLIHGWPGSVREFYEIIPKLTAPDSAKGDIVFEVIAPSLPGYAWSQAPARPGFGIAQMSVVLRNLMLRVGHRRFLIQGGDWGSALGSHIATIFPQNVLGYHSNMCFTNTPLSNLKAIVASFRPQSFVDPEHVSFFFPRTEKLVYVIIETGYMHLQATKPDTIGTALSQNPVGLLAYFVEKFSTWTNQNNRELPLGGWERFGAEYRDAILDDVMIYQLTNCITTSQRLYAESFTFAQQALKLDAVPTKVPTGCARFKHDLAHSMDWQLKDKYVNLVHSTYHEDGGHFAAMEKAQVLYEDFVAFVGKVKV